MQGSSYDHQAGPASVRHADQPAAMRQHRFWQLYILSDPATRDDKGAGRGGLPNRLRVVPGTRLIVSRYISARNVGLFFRGPIGTGTEAWTTLRPHVRILQKAVGIEQGEKPRFPFMKKRRTDHHDQADQQEAVDWLINQTDLYCRAARRHMPLDF